MILVDCVTTRLDRAENLSRTNAIFQSVFRCCPNCDTYLFKDDLQATADGLAARKRLVGVAEVIEAK